MSDASNAPTLNSASSSSLYPWQQHAWQALLQRHQQQGLPHALMFSGYRGLGKTHLRQHLAKWLLCSQPTSESGCNQCQSCQLMHAHSHPDILVVTPEEGKKQIRIDDIRQVNHFLSQTPQISRCQVVLLSPADVLNPNAANALLKTLEEPAGNSFLLLETERFGSVLPTIRSRCQRISLAAPTVEEGSAWLLQQLNAHGIEHTDESVRQALASQRGAPLAAYEYLACNMASQHQQWLQALHAWSHRNASLEQTLSVWSKCELSQLLPWWHCVLSTALKLSLGALNDDGNHSHDDRARAVLLNDFCFDKPALLALQHRLTEAQGRMLTGVGNDNRALLLESLLLDWQQTTMLQS